VRRLLVVALLAPSLALAPTPARAQAPDAVGWWSSAHTAALPVAPPAPPDVAPGDLLLQGGDVQREVPDTPPAPTAYAALRYAVPEGATVTALTLHVAAGGQASDVRAYATTATWQPTENGAIEDAPAPDLSRYAIAALSADGTTLTFPDIGKLVTDDGMLSVALVPGVPDRVVVQHPTATALTVQEAPPVDGPAPPPPVLVAPVVPGVLPAPQPVLTGAPLPPVTPQVAPTSAAPLPQVPAQPVAAAAFRRTVVGDDARTRLVVGLEALLVVLFFGLLGHGPLRYLARATGSPPVVEAERGIGRFRSARDGRAPAL